MILDLHRQGLSVSAIARQSGIDRKTVRKYIERGLAAPAYGPRKPRPVVIDAFAGYLRERVKAFPGLAGSRLYRELKELGYKGGYTAVTDFLRDVRPTAERGFEVQFETGPGELDCHVGGHIAVRIDLDNRVGAVEGRADLSAAGKRRRSDKAERLVARDELVGVDGGKIQQVAMRVLDVGDGIAGARRYADDATVGMAGGAGSGRAAGHSAISGAGVVFGDTNGDDFYTPGEALGGVGVFVGLP